MLLSRFINVDIFIVMSEKVLSDLGDNFQTLFGKYMIHPNNDAIAIKFSIKYQENLFLKIFCFMDKFIHKKYFLRVTYSNQNVEYFPLTLDEKDQLKPLITKINFHLATLNVVFDKLKVS